MLVLSHRPKCESGCKALVSDLPAGLRSFPIDRQCLPRLASCHPGPQAGGGRKHVWMGRSLELVESPLTARASGLCGENQLAEKSQVGVCWARPHTPKALEGR